MKNTASVVDHEISAYLMYICIGSEEKSTIHEIQWISWWNPADFMVKLADFIHESGGFHGWSWKMQTWKCKFYNAYNFFSM